MAQKSITIEEEEEAEFWLPPQFLSDESFLDDDDVDDDDFLVRSKNKVWSLSGSPQSTLCSALGGGGGGEQSSSRGSPNASSSPPPPATLSLLNAAAGEVAKIRSEEEQSPLGNPTSDFHRHYQFERLRQIHIMRQQQQQLRYYQIRQQQQRRNGTRTLGLPNSAWPTLQQARNPQNESGMRALFLGNPSAGKRESTGTGVFLPRQPSSHLEPRRKPVCSTVLLPARVVQALNLNLDEMGSSHQPQVQVQPRFNGRVVPQPDMTMLRLRSNNNNNNINNSVSYQKRNVRPQHQGNNNEIRLPQDWTY